MARGMGGDESKKQTHKPKKTQKPENKNKQAQEFLYETHSRLIQKVLYS